MTPIFTIHAGEYLVGSYIEEHFPEFNVWIPSKDKGIDLLLTDQNNQKTVSLQVKFSRDLLLKLEQIHGKIDKFQSYFWVTTNSQCWETRGLNKKEKDAIKNNEYKNESRDLTQYLNHWKQFTG